MFSLTALLGLPLPVSKAARQLSPAQMLGNFSLPRWDHGNKLTNANLHLPDMRRFYWRGGANQRGARCSDSASAPIDL